MQVSRWTPPHFLTATLVSVLAGLTPLLVLAEKPLPQIERLKSSPVLRGVKPNPVVGEPGAGAERTVAQMKKLKIRDIRVIRGKEKRTAVKAKASDE